MFKRQTLIRSTLATALLSAMFLSLPAHAGLLGGAIGVTGGLGAGIAGGMGGGFGPGSMNAGGMAAGQAAGQATGQGAFMPRVPEFTQQAGSVKQASTADTSEQRSVSRERVGNLGANVTGGTAAGNSGAATSARQADASAQGSVSR